MRVYKQQPNTMFGMTQHLHPETGEPIYLDKEKLLRNTQISPFQNSVRDNTNYYFKYATQLEDYLDPKAAPQKTFNRRLKIKNSYMTIFPMYGLQRNKDMFRSTQYQSIGTQLEIADKVDYTYYNKMDHIKIYTEEMLKAANMRMKKK